MSYNVSFMDTANNLYDITLGVNITSGGVLGIVILTIIFIISYSSSVKDGPVTALISSGLLSTVIALLLGFMGLIEWYIIIIPIMILFAGLIIKFFQK